jgi:8-oxo-dGTP diphosphatase
MTIPSEIIPNLSVDCVIFGFDAVSLNVLLVERTLTNNIDKSILFSDYTLTGNHVLFGEEPDHAAHRILKGLTGLDNIYLEQFHTFGEIDRLSEERDQQWIKSLGLNIASHVITVCYFSLINSSMVKLPKHQATAVKWFPVKEIPDLAFDHLKILQKALERLRLKLRQEPIGFELLPQKFTLTQLQNLYEAVLGTVFDPRNFRKKISQMKYLIPLDEKQTGVRHKPAQYYIFSRDVYERTRKEKLDFSI